MLPSRYTASPQLFILAAVVLLIFPFQWILTWLIAVVIHELFHYAALRLCKVQIVRISVGMVGVKMHTGPMAKWVEFLCALAGPMGSLFLLMLARLFPFLALCGVLHAAYNLLPLYPLDGGRAVICLIEIVAKGRKCGYIYASVKLVVFVCLTVLSILALQHNLGPILLIFTGILFFRTGMENPLANSSK